MVYKVKRQFTIFCNVIAMIGILNLIACTEEENTHILVSSITVGGTYITDGTSTQMTAVVLPENATNKEVEWSVANEDIATIDQNGLLTAKSNGNVKVTATATDGSGISGSKIMGISGVIVAATSLTINGEDITDGKPKQYAVTINPADATNQEVEWSVSDPSIANMSADGLLTPLDNGSVTITATLKSDNTIKDELQVNISGYVVVTEVPAFPGAEGFGRNTTGGRGGRVIYVTNLDDFGPGSLRDAINQIGPRYIFFKVSGTIQLKSRLDIKNGNLTIAGQTAPGDGITLRDFPVVIDADNVIIRFIRFRMGEAANQEGDALGGRFNKNIIIDHCSMSWSTDECMSFYVNENTTVQWSIVSESLKNSVHGKGAHGYGGIWGGKKASFHHILLAHHDSRNPRLGETGGTAYALTDLVDLRNNVIYNWGNNSAYGGEAMNVNIVNNYYKPGPVTTKDERIISIDYYKGDETSPIYQTWGKFYISGNYVEGSTRATNDNWTYGVFNQFHSSYGTVSAEEKEEIKIEQPHDINNNVTTHTAQQAYELVLDYAGASLVRDVVDERIIREVRNGTYTYEGSNGSTKGIIDSQADVGGWPVLNSTEPPVDSSSDGMPDDWKISKGLNPETSDTNGHDLHNVYDNVEVYINSLVEDIMNLN